MNDKPINPWDTQIGGSHYKKTQLTKFAMDVELNPLQYSILQYVLRYKDKNGIEDLRKAKHCVELLLSYEVEKEIEKRMMNEKNEGSKLPEEHYPPNDPSLNPDNEGKVSGGVEFIDMTYESEVKGQDLIKKEKRKRGPILPKSAYLEAIEEFGRKFNVYELADKLDVHFSTVHKKLKDLAKEGFVADAKSKDGKKDNKKYFLYTPPSSYNKSLKSLVSGHNDLRISAIANNIDYKELNDTEKEYLSAALFFKRTYGMAPTAKDLAGHFSVPTTSVYNRVSKFKHLVDIGERVTHNEKN